MQKFCGDLRKHSTELIYYDKMKILPLIHADIESHNNQKFWRRGFQYVSYSSDDSNNNDENSDYKESDASKFHGNTVELDYVDDDYYTHDDDSDDEFVSRNIHDGAAGLDVLDDNYFDLDDDSDDEEFCWKILW